MLKDLSEYGQIKKSVDGKVIVTTGDENPHSRLKNKATFKERREQLKK